MLKLTPKKRQRSTNMSLVKRFPLLCMPIWYTAITKVVQRSEYNHASQRCMHQTRLALYVQNPGVSQVDLHIDHAPLNLLIMTRNDVIAAS